MTFVQLQTFLAVAETGSVRAAAERLVITQSAVSSSVAALQRSVGLKLVDRHGRGIRLTAAGITYADYARRILGLLTEARTAAAGDTDPGRGELRIAAITTVGEQILPGPLARFGGSHPHIDVRLEVGNRERVCSLLDHHEVDLAVDGTPRPKPGRPAQFTHAIRQYELIVVGPATGGSASTDAWASTRPWLAEQTWLLREQGSGTRAITQKLLANLAPTPQEPTPRVLTLGSNGAIREAVVAGLGVALVSRDVVARELSEGTMVEIGTPLTPLRRIWRLVSRSSRLPATAALFVQQLLADGDFTNPSDHLAPDGHRTGRLLAA